MRQVILILLILLVTPLVNADGVPVRVMQLDKLLRVTEFSVPATTLPLNAPDISAEITGRIELIPVQVGDRVKKGDQLVILDCRDHKSRLESAKAILRKNEALLAFASTQLKRASGLKNTKSISEELLEQRNADMLSATADHQNQLEQVKQEEIKVERCIITAPHSAVVVKRIAHVGELANPGSPLLSLMQLDHSEVSAELRHADATNLQQATAVSFYHAGKSYPLNLRSITPIYDNTTRTQEARLVFVDASASPGSSGRLVWQGEINQLPANYLVRRNAVLGVFLAENGTVRFHALPNAEEGQPAELNLSPEQLIVTEGRQRLQDGDHIEVVVEEN
jgi:RND family efflux transporter MFP subunit